MSLFDKFQALVGRDVGANRLFVAAAGYFNVGDVAGGADGTDITGAQLKNTLLSPVTRTSFTMASAIQTVSVIPTKYGLVYMIFPSATTSVKLPSAEAGATLLLNFSNLAASTVLSILPGNGPSVVNGTSNVSCILVSVASTAPAWLELACYTQGEWAVARVGSAGEVPQGA